MTIKVKHILLVILIVIVATILYNVLKKPINEMLEQKKHAKQIINYLNSDSFENISDGAIVGSAIVRVIAEYGKDAPKQVGKFVKEMKEAYYDF